MVTVTEIPNRTFVHPNARQARALHAIVCAAVPKLAPMSKEDTVEHFAGYCSALDYVGSTLIRSDQLNMGLAMTWFADDARHWLNQRGRPSNIEAAHIVLAAMSLDVKHSFQPSRFPYDMSLGLMVGGGSGTFSTEWKRVLERATVLPATPLPGRVGQRGRRAM